MPKHSIYFSDKVLARLELDPAGVEGMSARVSGLCCISLDLMREAIPKLSLVEWQAMLDISNGCHRDYECPAEAQAEAFRFSISESGPECDEKWGVRCVDLARRFGKLPLVSQLATMEVCRRFWLKPDINKKYDNYRDILEAHGARFTDDAGAGSK